MSTTVAVNLVNEASAKRSLWAFALGLAVCTAYPPEGTMDSLRIPLVGSYIVSYFEVIVGLSLFVFIWRGDVRLDSREKKLYRALAFVILTRALSLVFAGNAQSEQILSVLRYVSTFVTLVLLASILTTRPNRRLFVIGILFGALLESIGGPVLLFTSQGEDRGIWLGLDNYELQVFALVFLCLLLTYNTSRMWKLIGIFVLVVGVTATEVRRALVLVLLNCLVIAFGRYRSVIRPIVAVVVIGAVAVGAAGYILPDMQQSLSERAEQLWTGGGTIGYRMILWQMAAAAYLAHPITGIGSGGFARQQDALYFQISDALDRKSVV